ncbi:thioesterase II family protein [Micromonospora sp. DT201]|uniref:thioesterase II family protein n=1 Tax=Micromonospora sp. DT201 TaxID=3393442 RepID=UPI003CEE5BE5
MPISSSALIRPRPRPDAPETLVCLSFCGGGTSPMRAWARTAPERVEVALVCYPGREGRYSEPFAPTWSNLVDDVLHTVEPILDRPFTLMGHSMGGWVAFDVAVELRRRGQPTPEHLVVSAAEPPTRWRAKQASSPRYTDTDDQLVAWMRSVGQINEQILAEPDLRAMAVDLLRADLGMRDSYRYVPGTAVDIPMTVLYGAEDRGVNRRAAEGWRDLTMRGCVIKELPGGHFYDAATWPALPAQMLPAEPAIS